MKTQAKPNPGAWDSTLVSIYEGDVLLGSYERRHPGWSEETFYPFQSNGNWLALYSADYTATRVMSLPDCKDIGGETPASNGFCPVEFYVPSYRKVTWSDPKTGKEHDRYEFDNADRFHHAYEAHNSVYRYDAWQFMTMGFVAGCHWGDDTSWKVEALDLKHAAQGELKRAALFGHFELPHKKSLKDFVDFSGWSPEHPVVSVTRQEVRHLYTGALIDRYDR